MSACARTTPAALTPDGARVRVSEAIAVDGCDYIGNFTSDRGAARPMANPWAANQVRNLAAENGATDVVLDVTSGGGTFGKGYRCP